MCASKRLEPPQGRPSIGGTRTPGHSHQGMRRGILRDASLSSRELSVSKESDSTLVRPFLKKDAVEETTPNASVSASSCCHLIKFSAGHWAT